MLSDPELHRIILVTVAGNGDTFKHQERLKSSIRREVQICDFTGSYGSARSILDTILGSDPIKLQDIQDKLDWISTTNHSFFSAFFEDPDRDRR